MSHIFMQLAVQDSKQKTLKGIKVVLFVVLDSTSL